MLSEVMKTMISYFPKFISCCNLPFISPHKFNQYNKKNIAPCFTPYNRWVCMPYRLPPGHPHARLNKQMVDFKQSAFNAFHLVVSLAAHFVFLLLQNTTILPVQWYTSKFSGIMSHFRLTLTIMPADFDLIVQINVYYSIFGTIVILMWNDTSTSAHENQGQVVKI